MDLKEPVFNKFVIEEHRKDGYWVESVKTDG